MRHHPLKALGEDDDDPMLSAVNLVDVFLVVVAALLVALTLRAEREAGETVTVIRNAGKPDMEIVVRENGREVKLRGDGSAGAGNGVRTGVAYRLDDGSVVYLPEPAASGSRP
ncbi:DUF2149 domain-containing protein [Aquabacterium sp. A7-Y]|uniref:DUF2149 domain-containing protein n=1 Tax=Aquabacterium sp. A7-Y TaxID=1349605 RepID=UPI00223D5DC4|nr:DUF2149 domain-containing protein [Aquabacterium sp. A7-Y]MCW7539939.1 DUF2149 domain-containing protein [Aquabacterium sp. A7-Y]